MDKRIGLLITAAAAALGIVWFVRRGKGAGKGGGAGTPRAYVQAPQKRAGSSSAPATASTRQGESGASARAMTATQRAQSAADEATARVVEQTGEQPQAPLYTTVGN